jgi:hypothetical protein
MGTRKCENQQDMPTTDQSLKRLFVLLVTKTRSTLLFGTIESSGKSPERSCLMVRLSWFICHELRPQCRQTADAIATLSG